LTAILGINSSGKSGKLWDLGYNRFSVSTWASLVAS
jgi:hypothetical protein